MTRDQLSSKIRQNLDDESISFYTEADLNESIQDAYDEIVVFSECIEKNVTLNFNSNTTYYDLSTLVSDYYRIIKLYNNSTNRFIDADTDRSQLRYRDNWETIQGQVNEFTILGPKYIGFSGRNSTAIGSFKLFYKGLAPTLTSGSSIFLINDNYIELIELYSTADLLEQNQEFIKASKYWQLYDPMLEDYRRKIQLLSKADRVFTR